MFLLRKPSDERIGAFRKAQSALELTYRQVGATSSTPPTDYIVDHTRVKLGEGHETFEIARQAMEDWQHFHLGWISVASSKTLICENEVVVLLTKVFGMWAMCACRIVDVIEETKPRCRFGFAYGTLPGHPESGEERFLIEIDDDGIVWYDILAFSKPHHPLAKIGYPFVRRLQKRFARDSAAKMQYSVSSIDSVSTIESS